MTAPTNAAAFIRRHLNTTAPIKPRVGIILGSGLGQAANRLVQPDSHAIPFASIPGMPTPQVVGHSGKFVSGQVGNVPVAILQGRVHSYEGHALSDVEFGTRVLHALGVEILIVTNAAGGVRSDLQPGNLMLISDHLRPLSASWFRPRSSSKPRSSSEDVKTADDELPAVTCRVVAAEIHDRLWNPSLRQKARCISTPLQVHEGVYAMMSGPNYETPAEIRAIRTLGADAVGMSTVPEALLAASVGIRVLGVSCITNIAAGLSDSTLNHTDVTATARGIEDKFVDWLHDVICAIDAE